MLWIFYWTTTDKLKFTDWSEVQRMFGSEIFQHRMMIAPPPKVIRVNCLERKYSMTIFHNFSFFLCSGIHEGFYLWKYLVPIRFLKKFYVMFISSYTLNLSHYMVIYFSTNSFIRLQLLHK